MSMQEIKINLTEVTNNIQELRTIAANFKPNKYAIPQMKGAGKGPEAVYNAAVLYQEMGKKLEEIFRESITFFEYLRDHFEEREDYLVIEIKKKEE